MDTDGVITENYAFCSYAFCSIVIQGHAAEGVCTCLLASGIEPLSELFEQATMRLCPHECEK